MKQLLSVITFLASAAAASAQVTFTITATANGGGFGYTPGQVVTFSFTTTGADLTGNIHNGNAFVAGSHNLWSEDFTSDTQLFTAVSATGFSGTYTRPSGSGDPFSAVDAVVPGFGQLSLQVKSEAFSSPSIGFTAGGFAVSSIVANQLDWGQSFPAPGTYTPLNTYFAPYVGTHSLNPGGYVELFFNTTPFDFTPSSITISVVPEPWSYAALFGFAALGLAAHRRRRARG